jgi:hypothetical protein
MAQVGVLEDFMDPMGAGDIEEFMVQAGAGEDCTDLLVGAIVDIIGNQDNCWEKAALGKKKDWINRLWIFIFNNGKNFFKIKGDFVLIKRREQKRY